MFHSDSRNEERRRLNGELAINLSSIADRFVVDVVEEGCQVAVIDCMSFVPEWIPALEALGDQKGRPIPFDHGRHLNLRRDSPVVSSENPSDPSTISFISASGTNSQASADPLDTIKLMVHESQLEPIRDKIKHCRRTNRSSSQTCYNYYFGQNAT